MNNLLIKDIEVDNLKIKIFETREDSGKYAADEAAAAIIKKLKEKAEVNIIFAAAPSQNEFLYNLSLNKDIDWSMVNAFHMDEYIGLKSGSPQLFSSYLDEHIFSRVSFKNIFTINPAASDLDSVKKEEERYAKLLEDYPADVVCMGIGENGHIAFNDPHVAQFNDKYTVKTVELDNVCRMQQVNDKCFSKLEEVPTHAITLTIPALMAGESIFCIVPGSTKAEAVNRTVNGDISEECPATILRRHKNAIMYLDRQSASKIL